MTLVGAVGQAHALDGREAGAQAAIRALVKINHAPVALGLVISSHDYPIQQVLSGVTSQLGDTPLLGFSSTAELTSSGQHQGTVLVGLLAGEGIQASAGWWPESDPDAPNGNGSSSAAQKMVHDLLLSGTEGISSLKEGIPSNTAEIFLFIADGLGTNSSLLLDSIAKAICANSYVESSHSSDRRLNVAGCLADCDRLQRSFQFGGCQAGSNGLAGALISGPIAMGVGVGHGWRPIGTYFKVTGSHGHILSSLDGCQASSLYANLFGHDPEEWRQPPLRDLVRLYPLGIETQGVDLPCTSQCPYLIRTPLRVEEDGSLWMIAPVSQGSAAHLLVGSVDSCLESARIAAHTALASFSRESGNMARPALAIVWVDSSWQSLLLAEPGSEIAAVRSVLGPDVPIIGGYTLGQITLNGHQGLPELLNQHIQVLLLGEKYLKPSKVG